MAGDNGNGNGKGEDWFYKYIRESELLTFADEQRLLRRAKLGDREASNDLIESNMRLVRQLARRRARDEAHFQELVSEGVHGLYKTIEKFDFAKGKKFSTYATRWIRKFIGESIRKERKLVLLPPGETGEWLAELIFSRPDQSPGQGLEAEGKRRLVDQFLACLDPRSAEVLRLRYGIGDDTDAGPPKFKEIGQKIGRTKARASQIAAEALAELQHLAKEERFSIHRYD